MGAQLVESTWAGWTREATTWARPWAMAKTGGYNTGSIRD